ncbi:MAG: threonine synthase [Candidatus Altiarchaeota archaeon]|nr:threonine synthase [Candidatus Altiarchaeota archaeon]
MDVSLKCIDCGRSFKPGVLYRCSACNGLLDVVPDLDALREVVSRDLFDSRLGSRVFPYNSGIWRFRELIHPLVGDGDIVSRSEGNTSLYSHRKLEEYAGINDLRLKHEGENPTGSFKDRGMSPGVSEARRLGMEVTACASTGNTSASLAAYSSLAGLSSVVFIPEGNIAFGKLSQALAYGARVLQVEGNFDDAMALVQESASKLGLYLLNSVNPWRVEGQKSIMFELVQQLGWEPPDWVVVPAGNLGNTSAFGKAFAELEELGLVDKIPKIASIQASGADPFFRQWKDKTDVLEAVESPETIATAIRIGNPVSWRKALRSIRLSGGVVDEVSDQEIMDAKAVIDSSGIGCEPASAASLAGVRKLRRAGVIDEKEDVVCIVTGNILKDPEATVDYHLDKLVDRGIIPSFANRPVSIKADLDSVREAIK